MEVTKDSNGIFYLKWTGGHVGVDHKITDLEDPRCEMNYVTKEDHEGVTWYYYGVTQPVGVRPFIEMTKTWLKQNVTFFEGGENKTVVMKKNYAGRWVAVLRTMIRMTI
jgi:hypothetical protein